MKIRKNTYLLGFVIVVALLALTRLVFEGDNKWTTAAELQEVAVDTVTTALTESEPPMEATTDSETIASAAPTASIDTIDAITTVVPMAISRPHRINGVTSYHVEFPDSNDRQLSAARRWGVTPVKNRQDAEQRMKELVYVGANPYFHIDPLYSSIPYLVPRASVLLQDIGRAFQDSLYVKGVPLHRIIVTSVLRTEADVARLRRGNGNATENSCHLYGTTVDICYNRYQPITREVRNDTLKWVLSEVLRDMRRNGRCYIKHEVKQGCFHLTVR